MSETTPRDVFFWFDCETGGLRPNVDTVLEVAWCFTDEHLRMISPLRQRFTKLAAKATGRDGRRPADQYNRLLDPTDESSWHDNSFISPVARQMHEESGLRSAWFDAYATNPNGILTHSRDFYRLVVEDMHKAGITSQDRIALAGAGVSHFDDSVLTEVFDEFYPRRPIIDGGVSPVGRWHYRCFDTSVALWVAGPGARAAVDAVAARLEKTPDPDRDEAALPFDLIECEQQVDNEVMHLVNINSLRQGVPFNFERSATIQHRAADDVVWSLLDARALRYWISRGSL
ncbi:hypothetical protein [Actinophytocola sp.]|uniref:hypothetical protein n=1 Tax=Actinophytocola sp. TaxID=1872138 RepID=UPI002D7EB209|nr:hypothetical protein [Actinophytocola sp.]HET9144127.1 hypothetical protein [Actinophytocola sp.]